MNELIDPSKKNEVNVTYLKDNEYSIQLIRWFLTLLGAWESSTAISVATKLRSIILIIFYFALICFTFVPCTLYALLEEENLQAKMKALGQVSYWIVGAIKYGYILFHRKNVRRCLDNIETDWFMIHRSKDRDIMLLYASNARYFVIICTSLTIGGVLMYSLLKGMTTVPVLVDNHTAHLHILPCPCYSKLVDTTFHPAYEIIYGIQFFSAVITSSIVGCACSLTAVFVMHACGQLAMMMAWMQDSFNETVDPANYELADIVGLHVRVLSFIDYIENMFNRICLAELLGSTLNMCLLGYFCITVLGIISTPLFRHSYTDAPFMWNRLIEWENHDTKNTVGYFLVFVSMMFNIFVFCFLSETLSDQCQRVGDVAYACDWHLLPKNTACGFVLIILKSNYVVRLTAGKFIPLSIITFGDVVKTSAVYFNMLQKMA